MEIQKLGTGPVVTERPARAGEVEPVHRAVQVDSQNAGSPDARFRGVQDLTDQVRAIEALREKFNAETKSRLQIDREEDARGRFIYRFLDEETGEVVRQWPPENYLDLIEYLRSLEGGLVNREA